MRESGFYWIRIRTSSPWEPAQWVAQGEYWMVLGTETPYAKERIFEIGHRIECTEICICAAIKTPAGIIRGHRHGDCFYVMQKKGIDRSQDEVQGFMTSMNRFVDRNEGRRLQDKAGIASASPEGYEFETLFSEDLY
jgi:hypothetical protein